jgi:ligand-binding sensor domain-containing protein
MRSAQHGMDHVSRSAVMVLGFLLAMSALGRAERLPIKVYTTADGLAQNAVNRIVRDSRGFLWFCTDEGLSRFDGYTFTNYTTADGLPHPVVASFLETRSGVYWVGTYSGLCRFNPSRLRIADFRLRNERPKDNRENSTIRHPPSTDDGRRTIRCLSFTARMITRGQGR